MLCNSSSDHWGIGLAKLTVLKLGETVFIDGPYGLFSHLVLSDHQPIIMIAGGIGITPMLSMLRYMADVDDPRRVLLIWSKQNQRSYCIYRGVRKIKHRLQHFHIIYVLHVATKNESNIGRLDQTQLDTLLKGWGRQSAVFICGPVEMMKDMTRAVKNIGFSPARVYKEAFKL